MIVEGQRLGHVCIMAETEEQLAALEKLRCERIQGFLIARPLPPADLHALLTE